MTWYVILKWVDEDWSVLTDPMHYLDAKKSMQLMKKQNPGTKYKMIKTSY